MKTILLKNKLMLSLMLIASLNFQLIYAQTTSSTYDTQSFTLEFNSVNGPSTTRVLELSFSETTSDNFDEGLDTKNLNLLPDDLNLLLSGELYTSQAYSPITEDKIVDLVFQASGDYNYTIALTAMENMGTQGVELRDNLYGITYDLTSGNAYQFSSVSGYFPNRFDITFKAQTLSQNDFEINDMDIRYVNNTKTIVITNPNNVNVERVEVFNIAGQKVYDNTTLVNDSSINYQLNNLVAGIYVIRLATNNNDALTKKVIAN